MQSGFVPSGFVRGARVIVPLVAAFALLVPQRVGAATPAAAQGAPHADGTELLVRLRHAPRVARLGATALADFDAACGELGATRLVPLCPTNARHAQPAAFQALALDRVVRLRVPSAASGGVDLERALARLRSSRDVELAYQPGLVAAASDPNDPLFASQWPLQSDKLAASAAWDLQNDATGVVIAVLDSGSDMQHGDFKANRWINTGEVNGNGVDDDGNGYVDDRFGYDFVNGDGNPDDDYGHGTQVAGIVGAVGNNSTDLSGVCWVAEVMSCKVLSASGGGTFADVAEAVTYAADNGARVANMSIVTTIDDPTLRAAVDYARLADVVQIAAAGNSGDEVIQYPAGYDGVIGVIATTSKDQRWANSSHGSWCDVAAPGVSVLTLRNGGGTITQSGTSLAAPQVAGIAALVRKINPDLDRLAVELTIEYASEDFGTAGFDNDFGWGRVNAELALKMARALHADAPTVAEGTSIDLHLDVPEDAGYLYVLLPTTTGRLPGIALSTYDPADSRVFPLNVDWLQGWVLAAPTNPLFQNFISTLDAGGAATATFLVPKRIWRGFDFDFAFVTLDPGDLAHVVHVSEPCRIHVQ